MALGGGCGGQGAGKGGVWRVEGEGGTEEADHKVWVLVDQMADTKAGLKQKHSFMWWIGFCHIYVYNCT